MAAAVDDGDAVGLEQSRMMLDDNSRKPVDSLSPHSPRRRGIYCLGEDVETQDARPAAPRRMPDKPRARLVLDLSQRFLVLSGEPALDAQAWTRWCKAVDFLVCCEYPVEDICCVLAHASAYFGELYAVIGKRMTADEAGHMIVVLLYIAHSYVVDRAGPLHKWQLLLCSARYDVKVLDAAIVRLLTLRGFCLRLQEDELQRRYSALHCAALGHRV